MGTTIRSSNQLIIDADVNANTKKVTSLAAGTVSTDAVNLGQMTTAISNAVSGVGNAIHVPVANLAAAVAVVAAERTDKMIMLIETLGLYRYDAESTATSNSDTVIRPTDIATDATAGRWIKMSSTITDHNNLSNLQGGTSSQYYHLTSAELTKLQGNLTGEVTSVGNATTVTNAAVIGKVLTGFTAGAGTVAATDTVLAAIQKLAANDGTNANLTGMVTSVGNATTVVTNANLTGGVTSVGNATTVVTNANLTGEVTSVGNATTVTNAAVIGKVLTGFTAGAGTVAATDSVLAAIQKLAANDATNANLTGMVTSTGNATTVVTNANLTGEVTSVGNATTVTNAAVIGKVLTGFTAGAGTVAATDSVLAAIQKLAANDGTNANLTGMVTSVGNATTVVTNANLTGGVTSVGNATTVVTNANLTGEVTSVGNATTVTNAAVIGKVLTGFTAGAGTVAATDTVLAAIQKLAANDATNANLTGMVTSTGNATTVVTNANLTGPVTSVGNATTITANSVGLTQMADIATASFMGRNTAATGDPEVLSIPTVKTMLGLTVANQSTRTYRATPTGTVNGSNTAFTIAALVLSGTEEVFKNGLLMNASAGNDYTISYGATTTITFLTAPSSSPFTDIILVNYSV